MFRGMVFMLLLSYTMLAADQPTSPFGSGVQTSCFTAAPPMFREPRKQCSAEQPAAQPRRLSHARARHARLPCATQCETLHRSWLRPSSVNGGIECASTKIEDARNQSLPEICMERNAGPAPTESGFMHSRQRHTDGQNPCFGKARSKEG